MDKKKLLLIEPDKEQSELFTNWLKEESYEVNALGNPDQVSTLLSKENFDILIMDIDSSETIESSLELCRSLKKESRTQDLPITVVTYRKNIKKIASAIDAGVDSFVLKPFETDFFLDRIKTIIKQIKIGKQGKKALDLNYINYLIKLASEADREGFFLLTSVIVNKLIIEKVKPVIGKPVMDLLIKRANEQIGQDYEFMKKVEFPNGRFLMDAVDKDSKEIPLEKLTTAFRDYVYAFLQLVQTLTSDILMERGKV